MGENNIFQPVEIGRLLPAVFKKKKWRSKLELHRVFEFWDKTVGKEIAAVAQPALIRSRSVLWVKVKDPIWMQQLHLQKMLLLEKINRQLNDEQLSDIHFQLDSSLTAPPSPETEKIKPTFVDKTKEQEFDKLISCLGNEDLKNSLKNLWVRMQKKN